jgi:hypothetical protein
MLDCLVDSSECLYRIHRDLDREDCGRIVYVYVKDPSIIPDDARTHGPSLLKHLEEYVEWNQVWTTLTILKVDGQTRCLKDLSPPPSLHLADCPGHYPLFQITQLKTIHQFKQRVSQVELESKSHILKIATFAHEVRWIRQEIKVYHYLTTRNSGLVPRLLGYACEQERIIGFLCEMVVGRVPSTDDIEVCRRGLDQLHREGVIHGDINKYNIFITAEGLKFVDLEDAILVDSIDDAKGLESKFEEMERLKPALGDSKSGLGRPWNLNS